MPTNYSESAAAEWTDVTPIPLDSGGPQALAAISYTDEYSEAMAYLRAVMSSNEKSERVLRLTGEVVERMNPANYTVWLYRADTVFELKKDLHEELRWLDGVALKHLKNYQIWHHRQTIMSHISTLPANELPFLSAMFARDAKNYHVWSYRQWLVRHFSLWEASPPDAPVPYDELAYVDTLLRQDVRNNSAWNHRWFVVFGRCESSSKAGGAGGAGRLDPWLVTTSGVGLPALVEREIEYTKKAIELAPQNPSPWNYLRGVLRVKGQGSDTERAFAERFADLAEGKEGEVRSSHALDFLADVWAEKAGEDKADSGDSDGSKCKEKAGKAWELLALRYDPIRRNYWNWRRSLIGLGEVVEA